MNDICFIETAIKRGISDFYDFLIVCTFYSTYVTCVFQNNHKKIAKDHTLQSSGRKYDI